ncbi:hypothetical protein N7523_005502 [Penicillium sp. IBT 18751x]|nr:hypothetical protein N7523_005502 [Penicillium sp. IBT 18751x]
MGNRRFFTYTERNDTLGPCVIRDTLEYALLDDSFASEHIKCPRGIWNLTKVPVHRLSTPVLFKEILKEAIEEIPIFRRAMKSKEVVWITDPRRAMTCSTALEYE